MPGAIAERVLCEECLGISTTVFSDLMSAYKAIDAHEHATGHVTMGVVTDDTVGAMVWEAYADRVPGSFVIKELAGIDETS